MVGSPTPAGKAYTGSELAHVRNANHVARPSRKTRLMAAEESIKGSSSALSTPINRFEMHAELLLALLVLLLDRINEGGDASGIRSSCTGIVVLVVINWKAVTAGGRRLDVVRLDDMPARAYPLDNALMPGIRCCKPVFAPKWPAWECRIRHGVGIIPQGLIGRKT